MPKISKITKRIKSKTTERKFDYEVLYNQTHHFYVLIPAEFRPIVLLMSRDERNSFSVASEKQNKGDSGSFVVAGSTEYEAKELFEKLISTLMDRTIQVRKVIMLFYQKNGDRSYNSHRFNPDHPLMGSEFGLTYAEEITTGTEKQYQVVREHPEVGQRIITPFKPWDSATTVIDDTPENRAQVEQLYLGLVTLYNKIKEVTSTEESLVKFIEGTTKLLLS